MKNRLLILFVLLSSLFQYSCESNSEEQNNADSTARKDTTQMLTPAVISTKPAKEATTVYGIDISQFQGNEVDFLNKQKDNLTFVFCKATEGITYTDPDFRVNWKMIPEKGFIRGAYHFYRTADDASGQAENFINAIKDISATDLPPVVDFEGGGIDKSESVESIQNRLLEFLELIEQKLQRKPMIYTDIPSGNKYLNDPRFGKYALWIALYEDLQEPKLPKAWKKGDWTFWQKSSSHEINGKKNDFDQFNGDLNALNLFIQTY